GALREFARRAGATPFMVGLAAYQVLLSRYTGSRDIVVGTPLNGRSRPELEPLIGFFAWSLPIRVDLSGDPPFSVVVDRVKQALMSAYRYSSVPFDRVVDELGVPRDLSRNPVFQVWFDLAAESGGRGDLPRFDGTDVELFDLGTTRTRFDLEAHLVDTPGGDLRGRLLYATDLFDRITVERFARHYANVLGSAAEDPDRRLSGLRVFDGEELAWLTGADAG
ncbi:MAG: non-ribosomal peptide synthetase, partial [Saccharothrix sp.]|nr:non-ribosomal peptide synthetase [Saccharothrix sp.]